MKKWDILQKVETQKSKVQSEDIIQVLLENRGLKTKAQIQKFLLPSPPEKLTVEDVGIEAKPLMQAIARITKAITKKESVVVYADYDADGITAGAIVWEALYNLGVKIMPYIPHRVDEGYGLSLKGIDTVKSEFNPGLIITVDQGVTAYEKVEYAKSLGIDVIVTDHHVKPEKIPDCCMVHTTDLSGSGIAWFLMKEIYSSLSMSLPNDYLAIAAIGTIADMVPLTGANRTIAKYGLEAINHTERVGLLALIGDAGLTLGDLGTYDISHIIAPRLNAMGRLVHAMDALRLLCAKKTDKATELASKLGMTNKERQQLTSETTAHAMNTLKKTVLQKKLLFIHHETYNQGVIGLVAGKLVEEYYRPAIVIARGEEYSKASARSIVGFNIVEVIRSCSDILVDVGGHPMAAGFTVETKNLEVLQKRLEEIAEHVLNEEKLTRLLRIDTEIPLECITEELWEKIQQFEPFGMGNFEPVFATKKVKIVDSRLVGAEGKHLKLKVAENNCLYDAIAFGFGNLFTQLKPGNPIDIAYTIDMNVWNGNRKLQLKIKDISI